MNAKEKAERLAAEGKCILCETPATGLVRGLCRMHRARYQKARAKVPAELRQKFDKDLVERGCLLETRQGMRADSPRDEFADALGQFLGQLTAAEQALVDRVTAEALAKVEQLKPVKPPADPKREKKP